MFSMVNTNRMYFRKAINVIVAVVAFCTACNVQNREVLTVDILEGESWWGLSNTDGYKQPFSDYSLMDLANDSRLGETVPFLVSSKGRYIWCDSPFKISCEDGKFSLESYGEPVQLVKAGDNLKDAYMAASKKHFPFDSTYPAEELFVKPQFNNWIESCMMGINQQSAEEYVKAIGENDFPCGVLMIDGGWIVQHGTMRFNTELFPDGKALFDLIRSRGYKSMLWISPYISGDNRATFIDYRLSGYRKSPLLVESTEYPGEECIIYWWSGRSVSLDLTNPQGLETFAQQLEDCQKFYGIDGFKFDGGEAEYFRHKAKFYDGATAADYAHAYGELCRRFPYHEFRVGYRNGGAPIMVRLMDVPHDWEKLPDVLYNIQVSGLMGLPYTVGDMIGGGLVTHIPTDGSYSNKYMVRSCQLQTLMPMMQFSMAPWRVLSKKECDICREMANLHVSFSDYIMEQVRHAAKTGEPIVRMMDYEFPGQGFDRKMPQFMLGPDYLVAPVLCEDDSLTVELPAGQWLDDQGETFIGPQVLNLKNVPLERLPYYKKIR